MVQIREESVRPFRRDKYCVETEVELVFMDGEGLGEVLRYDACNVSAVLILS